MEQLFYNGVIYCGFDFKVSEAMLVKDDIIVALGKLEELRAMAGVKTLCHDLQGRAVVPGFQDSHCHLLASAMHQDMIDLSRVTSKEQLIRQSREFIARNNIKKGEWVIGRGFNQNLFDEPILPDVNVADAISVDHPILLDRVCGHMGTLNTLAIETLGINETMVIPGGAIGKDRTGKLNGIFYETALEHVKSQLPTPNPEQLYRLIKKAGNLANSMGLTSVHSNDVTTRNVADFMNVIQRMESANELTVRIFEEVQASSVADLAVFEKLGLKTGSGNDHFQIGNIKIFTDGSLGARSAYMRSGYADQPGNRGIRVHNDRDLQALIAKAHEMDFQVACHAIGDGAISQCIDAIEHAQAGQNKDSLRHRIVHCQIADDSLLERMARSRIAADIQPPFVATDWQVAEKAFGDRVGDSYRWKTMQEMGIHLGGGSDSPVESLDPIWGIHCAVNRLDSSDLPSEGWHPEEKFDVAQALALYTQGPAYLSFEEDRKGILAPGYLGDFVVLSDDLFEVAPESIKDVKVLKTFVGGRLCFF